MKDDFGAACLVGCFGIDVSDVANVVESVRVAAIGMAVALAVVVEVP